MIALFGYTRIWSHKNDIKKRFNDINIRNPTKKLCMYTVC